MTEFAWVVVTGVAMSAIALVGSLVLVLPKQLLDVTLLVPFEAGNFVYIRASDLLPQLVEPTSLVRKIENSVALVGGMLLLLVTAGAV